MPMKLSAPAIPAPMTAEGRGAPPVEVEDADAPDAPDEPAALAEPVEVVRTPKDEA